MRVTPFEIKDLEANEVFVFGSNESGIHGAGAARLAYDRFGARIGQGFGLIGQSFALPTKDWSVMTLELDIIEFYINRFEEYVRTNSHLNFMITRIGCGLAGYDAEDIAPLFKNFIELENVYLPEDFIEIINNLKLEK
jgi:hypothetical protein